MLPSPGPVDILLGTCDRDMPWAIVEIGMFLPDNMSLALGPAGIPVLDESSIAGGYNKNIPETIVQAGTFLFMDVLLLLLSPGCLTIVDK